MTTTADNRTLGSAALADRPFKVLASHLTDPGSSWSLGTFGALAEFHRDPDEPVELSWGGALSAVTARGALRLLPHPDLRLFAYEQPSRSPEAWSHAVALCLPQEAVATSRRSVLTALGADGDALRPTDRRATLFDLGLACEQVEVCVRSEEPETLRLLRDAVGSAFLDPGNPILAALPRLSPHRVFLGPLGRIEVYQPIPVPGGKSPEGPHTHVLPDLLRHERTHAATVPTPENLIPCAMLYPANPLRDALGQARPFDAVAYRSFQALLQRHGDPATLVVKAEASAAVRAGVSPDRFTLPATRAGRAALRVALRQLMQTEPDLPLLGAWRRRFDAPEAG